MYQEITGPERWGPVQASDHLQTLGSYDGGFAIGVLEGGPGSFLNSARQTDKLLSASVSHLDTTQCCLHLTAQECLRGPIKADGSLLCWWGSALPVICAVISP